MTEPEITEEVSEELKAQQTQQSVSSESLSPRETPEIVQKSIQQRQQTDPELPSLKFVEKIQSELQTQSGAFRDTEDILGALLPKSNEEVNPKSISPLIPRIEGEVRNLLARKIDDLDADENLNNEEKDDNFQEFLREKVVDILSEFYEDLKSQLPFGTSKQNDRNDEAIDKQVDAIVKNISKFAREQSGRAFRGKIREPIEGDVTFQQIIQEGLFDDVETEELSLEANLTNKQILEIAQEFLDDIPFAQLGKKGFNDLVKYVTTHFKNEKLRRIILEELNLIGFREIPEKEITIKEEKGVVELEFSREEAVKSLKILDRLDSDLEAIEDDISDLGRIEKTKRTRKIQRLSRDLRSKSLKINNDLSSSERKKLERNFNILKLKFNPAESDLDEVNLSLDQFRDLDKKEILDDSANILKDAVNRIKGTRRIIASKPSKKVTGRELKTETNLDEFVKQLKRELKDIQKFQNLSDKQLAKKIGKEFRKTIMHRPKKKHKIGAITILTNDAKKIKEIIVEPFATNRDVVKLANALRREEGTIVDLNGKVLLKIKKDMSAKEILKVLFVLIRKLKTDHALRLLYQPKSMFGGSFLGGALTDHLYNKNNLKHIMFDRFMNVPRHGFHGFDSIVSTRNSIGFRPIMAR